jgi:hypothetical protein
MVGNAKNVSRGKSKTIQAPTVEEILAEIVEHNFETGYSAKELGEIFGRSSCWVCRVLVKQGFFEFLRTESITDCAHHINHTNLYSLTSKGESELAKFCIANGIRANHKMD